MESDKEIQDIKSKVADERASLESLNQKISDPGLREHITLAMAELKDVEQSFLNDTGELGNNELFEDRLLMARALLETATKTRKSLENRLKKSIYDGKNH